MASTSTARRPDGGVVTTKAFLRAGALLGMPRASLARVIGVSPPTLSRIAGGGRPLDPQAKEGELALLFLRVFRSLDALFGGNQEQSRLWLHASNTHLAGTPADLVQTLPGLIRVVDYLDAMRGHG